MRDLGYRYGFRIVAGAATALLATAPLPADRSAAGRDQPAGVVAIAVAVVSMLWTVPTMVVAWIEPDDPAVDEESAPL